MASGSAGHYCRSAYPKKGIKYCQLSCFDNFFKSIAAVIDQFASSCPNRKRACAGHEDSLELRLGIDFPGAKCIGYVSLLRLASHCAIQLNEDRARLCRFFEGPLLKRQGLERKRR